MVFGEKTYTTGWISSSSCMAESGGLLGDLMAVGGLGRGEGGGQGWTGLM